MNSKWSTIAGVIIVIAVITVFPLWTVDAAERQLKRHTATAPNLERIVFASNPDGDYDIYLMNTIGGDHHALTMGPGNDREPSWSPDGRHIVFLRQDITTGTQDLVVITALGEAYDVFTRGSAANDFSWSPDGRVLAYSEVNAGGARDIFFWSPGDAAPRAVTTTAVNEYYPAWSPDGTHIAFVSEQDTNPEIYLMLADGTGLKRLTNYPEADLFPQWSPDGRTILYQYMASNAWDLAAINLKVLEITGLSNHPAADILAAWSPDGTQIAFTSNRDGNAEVYLMRDDGTRQTNLTAHPAEDLFNSWSADGRYILFMSHRDGNWEVYRMLTDGSEQTRLTVNQAADLSPAWSP